MVRSSSRLRFISRHRSACASACSSGLLRTCTITCCARSGGSPYCSSRPLPRSTSCGGWYARCATTPGSAVVSLARSKVACPAEACRDAIQSPTFALGGECRPVGFVDVHVAAAPGALGHAVDFRTVLHRTGAEVVVVAGYLPDNRFREVVAASLEAETQLLSVPRSIAIAGVQPNLVWRRGQPLIELTAPNLKGWQVFVKRLLDVLGAGLGLIVLTPVIALVAAIVKLESRGPVLFTQGRVGQGGRRFRIVKV